MFTAVEAPVVFLVWFVEDLDDVELLRALGGALVETGGLESETPHA
jgi:hypothetical protein